MTSLCVAERHRLDDSPRLTRIVVRDRRLQTLALRRRLAELPSQPAEERDRLLRGHRCFTQMP